MWFLFLLFTVLLWLALSIKIVGPDEMAVKVYFGNPVAFCDSGIGFVPFTFGLCYLKRYPKKVYNFDYKSREVITKAGEEAGIQYGAQKLQVSAVAYLSFPKGFKVDKGILRPVNKDYFLFRILRAGIPIEHVQLKDWTEEAVVGALRLAFSQMTWAKAIEDMQAVNQKVSEVFRDINGILIKVGFQEEDIKLVISEIRLPKGVEDALPQPDRARLKADAAKDQAKSRTAEAIGTVLEMMAQSHGMTLEKIKKSIQGNDALKKEFQQYAMDLNIRLSEADRGAFFDFRSPDAKGLDGGILSLIALLKAMPGSGGNPAAGRGDIRRAKNPEEMTYEEKIKWARDRRKGKKPEDMDDDDLLDQGAS